MPTISPVWNDSLPSPSLPSSDVWLGKVLLGCLLFGLSIFTVCGNLLVLYAIHTEKRLRTVSNLFILSLAAADFIVGLVVMPLSAANIIAGRWPFSSLICQMWLAVDYVASTASIFNLVLLSLDRYWAVVHPLVYLRNRTRRRATHFIVLAWFLSFLWAPAVIFWSSLVPQHSDVIKPHECDTAFRSNKIFKTLTALGNFYLPLVTMIIISCRIMVAIRSRSTMECGRRISSSTQKQMRQERLQRNRSYLEHEKESHARTTPSISPFVESSGRRKNGTEIQSDENTDLSLQISPSETDSLHRSQPKIDVGRFSFSPLKPISILFPSLASIKEKNEELTAESLVLRNSLSASNDTEPPIRMHSLRLSPFPRTMSTSSFADDDYSPTTIFVNPHSAVPPSSSEIHLNVPSLNLPVVDGSSGSSKMTILTFVDYIINPSLSSSLQKELKAARQLGMLVGVFTVSWLPYFILFLVVAWCQKCVSDPLYSASIWLGYLNSTFNPLIYPLCNIHFRRAFRKTFVCQHAKAKLPNLNSLRELQTLNSIHQRRGTSFPRLNS